MSRKIAVILSKSGDRKYSAKELGSLTDALAQQGFEADIHVVSSNEEASDRAREVALAGMEIVAGVGGDGAVSAVAAGLLDTNAKLAVLPLGSFNHFAADMGIPADLEGAVGLIKEGVSESVDVGEVNRQIFLNNSAVGIYPQMKHEKEAAEGIQGKVYRFIGSIIKILRKYPSLILRAKMDGENMAQRTSFIFVGNNEYILEGLRMSRREGLHQGFLDVGVAQKAEPFHLIKVFVQSLLGITNKEPYFDEYHLREAQIDSRRRFLPVSLDGEIKIMRTPLRFRIRPKALLVILPKPA